MVPSKMVFIKYPQEKWIQIGSIIFYPSLKNKVKGSKYPYEV